MAETEIVPGRDLRAGDVILVDTWARTPEGKFAFGDDGRAVRGVHATVLRTGEKAKPDRFGRVFDAVWARREDTGAEGSMPYGPDGVFPVETRGPR